MKKVWIIAPFSSIESVGVRNRFQYIADRLHKEGVDVTLFTSSFSHMKLKHFSSEIIEKYSYKVKLINEPGYNKNVSIKRALSHIKFSINLKKVINKIEKPDIVYCAYPTMSASYIAGKYAKKRNIPFMIDIQDTWPESISSAIDTNKLIVKLIMWPFTKFANKIYKMADIVFGVSQTYVQRANVWGTKCKEFIPIYIGAELERFNDDNNNIGMEPLKKEGDIWITYIGTLSHSYDIDTAIKVFSELKEYKNIKLNILGSGPDEDRLINLSKELGTHDLNVYFHGFIDYIKMVAILKKTDVALNAIKGSAKQTITNKLGDYVSARLPILNSCQEIEVIDLINNKKIGLNYKPGVVTSLKDSILMIISNKKLLEIYSSNSKILAEEYFDRKESYKLIIDKIKSI